MPNSNISLTKTNQRVLISDEFYTRREDIDKELAHYADHFRDKIVYCNCDNPETSAFVDHFRTNFLSYGLKKLICTHYDPGFSHMAKVLTPAVMTTFENDGHPGNYLHSREKVVIEGNGDFRSPACRKILEEADIIVSNPPFSKIRHYLGQIMKYKKQFLIVGSLTHISYRGFFPLFKDDQVWLGRSDIRWFVVPKDFEHKDQISSVKRDAEGRKLMEVSAAEWLTNLPHKKRNTPIKLKETLKTIEDRTAFYDNFDAIDIPKFSLIPSDYQGVMGVPLSFMRHYCPDQFEIVGISTEDCPGGVPLIDGKALFIRVFIKQRQSAENGVFVRKERNGKLRAVKLL